VRNVCALGFLLLSLSSPLYSASAEDFISDDEIIAALTEILEDLSNESLKREIIIQELSMVIDRLKTDSEHLESLRQIESKRAISYESLNNELRHELRLERSRKWKISFVVGGSSFVVGALSFWIPHLAANK